MEHPPKATRACEMARLIGAGTPGGKAEYRAFYLSEGASGLEEPGTFAILSMPRFSALFAPSGPLLKGDWLTAQRIRRIGTIFALLALLVVGADAWLHTSHGVTNADGEQLGRDFVNYWAGAHLAADGQAARAYNLHDFLDYERGQTAANAHVKWYSYPPPALVLSLPLASMPFVPALLFWLLSGIAICAALLARTLGWHLALLAAFATPASLVNALWGQNGQFSAALLGGGLLFLESKPWLAGLLFGMLCYKPHLAVLVPVALACGGYWRAFLAAGIAALAICGSAFLLGPDVWTAFLKSAPLNASILEVGDTMWHRMPTAFAAIRLAGGSVGAAYAAQLLSALVAVAITIKIWRSGATLPIKASAMIVATFMVTPYAWDYDQIALIFVAAWLAAEGIRDGFRPGEKIVLALNIAAPLIYSPLAAATHVQVGPLALWMLLGLIARRALDTGHQHDRHRQARPLPFGRIA